MGQRRSKLDRHAAELLVLRRAGATIAQLTRWLRFRRDTIVAATTVARWLDNVQAYNIRHMMMAGDFDAVATLDQLRDRDRQLRFPRLAGSSIDEYGYHVHRLQRDGATIGECQRTLRDEHAPSREFCRRIGCSQEIRGKNLLLVVDNPRFPILPSIHIPTLDSHILAIVRRQLPIDCTARYNTTPVLIETFVETPRYTGAAYRASGWTRVGATQGRGRYDMPKKDI